MRRNIFILSIFLITGLFYGCDDDSNLPSGSQPKDGYAKLSVTLGASKTRAVDEFDTPDSEKEIKSVACFVQTNDMGEPGSIGYKQGGFFKYFFDNVEKNAQDQYVIDLEIHTASVAGETEVVMVANYKENGLGDLFQQIESIQQLENQYTNEVTESGIVTPLLMYATEKVALQMGSSVSKSFVLKRLMARIDIYNEVPLSAKRPFVLQSAQIINPKLYSYLAPGNDEAFNIPVFGANFDPKQPISSDPKKIEGLYTYETANDGSVEHTSILIKGTLGGEPYSKEIKLLKGTTPVPLARNTRYLITLNASSNPSEISFSFSVEDWSEGVTIPVKPSLNKPLLTGFTFGGVFNEGRWNEIEKIYNMEGQTTTGTISFSITGKQEIIPEVIPVFHVSGSEFDLSDIVKGGDVIDNRDGTITQHFTIEVSTAGQLLQKEPVDIYVYLKNSAKPSYKEVICITNLLNYPGTDFKPVWLGGYYWAPVNVGATQLEPDMVNGQPVRTNLQMGYYYQWGRNAPFYIIPGLSDDQKVQGPLSYAEANSSTNINKHINTPGADWLIDDDPNYDLRNSLWSNGNDNDNPCPPGWKIPSLEDTQPLVNLFDSNKSDLDNKRFTYVGDDGQYLYFPFVSHTRYQNGDIQPEQRRILFWTTTLSATKGLVASFDPVHGGSSGYREWNMSYGFTIRCIRK